MEFITAARSLRALPVGRFLFKTIAVSMALHVMVASADSPVTYPANVFAITSSDVIPWKPCMSVDNYADLQEAEGGVFPCIQASMAAVGEPPGSGNFDWSSTGFSGWSQSPTRLDTWTGTYTDNFGGPPPTPPPSHQGTASIQIGCPTFRGGVLGSTLSGAFGKAHSTDCMIVYVPQHQRDPNCNCSKPAPPNPNPTVGDPLNPNSGNSIQQATDYRGAGPFPLVFSRTYNSLLGTGLDFANYATGENLGKGWTNTIGAHLNINLLPVSPIPCQDPTTGIYYYCPVAETDAPVEITVWHADGSQAWFELPSPPATIPAGTVFPNEQGGMGQLTVVNLSSPMTGTGFQYLRNDGYTELYNATGQLLSVTNTYGLTQTYTYNSSNQVSSISDPFGRPLTFTYYTSGTATGLLWTMTNPAGGVYTYSYDATNHLQSVKYPDNSVVQYTYGENSAPANALTGLIDENDVRYATWSYNAQGQATSSVNAGNVGSVSIAYTTDPSTGDVTSAAVTEATGLVRTLTYTNINGQDMVMSESAPCVDCSDKTHTFTYDANGFVASRTDFDGNVTQYTHDGFGNETSRTEGITTANPLGERTITTQWNLTLNQPTLITEPGRTTGYTYDSVGHVLTKTVTDTATNVARTTTYTYYTSGVAAGLLYTVTDPLNHTTTYDYDNYGNLYSITNALNEPPTKITAYDANGMPLTIVDPNGVETDLTYDARQRLTSRTVASGTVASAKTQFSYDSVGQLIQVTLPSAQTCPNTQTVQGTTLQYKYDAAHRLTQVIDCFGNYIQYTLDSLGNRTGEDTYDPSNTLQKTLRRFYNCDNLGQHCNNLNQLITFVGGAGQIIQYASDSLGNVTGITDPMSTVAMPISTTQTFDALNRLSTIVDPEQGQTAYTYDALDRVKQVADPNHYKTQYSYDAFGDVVQQISPDTGTTTYTYDLAGNRLTKTDARGLTATYSYDALNRLIGVSHLDASKDVTYTYDDATNGNYGIGRLSTITDASGTTTYIYDAHGNTKEKDVTLGTHTFKVKYEYDAADNLTDMTYPSGLHVQYGRDAAERVTSVTANGNSVVSSITYEPFGPVTGMVYGNLLPESRSYDHDYRLTGISVPGVLGWTLRDNADDDIISITDAITPVNTQTLGYDSLNRLTSASGSYGTLGFAYDLDGNRTEETEGGLATDLIYDTVSNKLFEVGVQGYQYDAVGNLVSDGSHTYNYDVTSRLAGFDSATSAYVYNGLGQRSIKFPNVGADTTPPTVILTAPMDGAQMSGTVNVTASAADNVGVTSVQFYVDGTPHGPSETAAPYSVIWDTTGVNQGPHTLTATAQDAAGNSASASVMVDIPDTVPPTVSITTPTNGASVSGTVTLTATASDNVGVTSVQFQLDGNDILHALTAAPYNLPWDSTTIVGPHLLTAVAKDGSGNAATSAGITIIAPPTVPGALTFNPSGTNTTGNYTVNWSQVTAADAYKLYESTDGVTYSLLAAVSGGTTTSYAITGKLYGTYYYELASCVSGACSALGPSVSVLVSVKPIAPTGLSLSPNPSTSGNYSLSWNTTPGATSYQVYESTTGSYALVATLSGTSYNFAKSATGNYSYYVDACNPAGCSSNSSTMVETVSSGAAIPGTPSSIGLSPTGVTAGSGASYILTWGTGSGAVSYYQVNSSGLQITHTNYDPGTLSVTKVAPGNPHSSGTINYSVKACNTTGCSVATQTVTESVGCGVENPGGGTGCGSGGGGGGCSPACYFVMPDDGGIMNSKDELDRRVSLNETKQKAFSGVGRMYAISDKGLRLVSPLVIAAGFSHAAKATEMAPRYAPPAYQYFANAKIERVSDVETEPTTYFIYDESGHVIGEYDANGNPVQEHIYLGDRPVAVVTGGSSSSGTVDYVSTDQLNTPRVITDSSQTVLWSWNSDPFGNGQPTGLITYNLRFPGQYYDAETGHNYNYYRDYDATTGRYIESDLIGLLAGPNTYAYARGNPIRSRDMFGLNSTDCAKLLEEIYSTAQFLQGLINSYDPWSDGIGGWLSPRSGKPTRPGGHYDQIEQRQRQLGNDIAQYDRDCRKKKKCDDDDDEPPSPPVPQFIIDLANEDVPSPLIPALPDMPNFNIGPPPGFSPGASGFPAAPPPIIPVP